MTSLPAANCSRSLLLQSETRGRRWFDGVSVVQPVPMSMMTVSVVDLEVQRLAADRQSCRPARIHGDTDIPTRHAYTRFAAVHAANAAPRVRVRHRQPFGPKSQLHAAGRYMVANVTSSLSPLHGLMVEGPDKSSSSMKDTLLTGNHGQASKWLQWWCLP